MAAVASGAHHRGSATVLDANPAEGYRPDAYYGNTKLANLLFGRELQRRATGPAAHLTVAMAHPGVAATNLVASRDGMGARRVVHALAPYLLPIVLQSAARGADPVLFAATVAEPGSYTGPTRFAEWRGPIGPARLSRAARDDDLARRLWDLSERLTGVTYDP